MTGLERDDVVMTSLINSSTDHPDPRAVLDHPGIEGISFVGSTPTAKHIYERCGATGKRVQSLGGAKNIVAIMEDAKIDDALPSLVTSFFGCSGQRCLSGSILVPVGNVADELIEKFIASAQAMNVGPGLDEQTGMGPLISDAHRERVLGYIEKGIKEGADLIVDGRNPTVSGYENGFYLGSTIFDKVTPEMSCGSSISRSMPSKKGGRRT